MHHCFGKKRKKKELKDFILFYINIGLFYWPDEASMNSIYFFYCGYSAVFLPFKEYKLNNRLWDKRKNNREK